MNIFSIKIKNAIKSFNCNQKEFAEKLGVTPAHVSLLVRGEAQPSKSLEKLLDMVVAEASEPYAKLTPEQAEALRIICESPEAVAVVRMIGAVDSDTQKDIQRHAETEKRMYEKLQELKDNKAA